MDIGSRREIFVDHFLIDTLQGTELQLQTPRPADTAIAFDDPWATAGGYVTVIHDDVYRMYYKGTSRRDADNATGQVTCYAESADGIRWEKPQLGLFEVMGIKANNVVHNGDGPTSHNFSPFLDTNPSADSSAKYKALAGTKETGLLVFHSPDGIHWTQADQPPAQPPTGDETRYDSQNVSFWSEHEGCYCCYFRIFKDGIRTICRTTSPDYVEWSEPVLMDFGDTTLEHLYINQTHPYFRAKHIYVALPARFMAGRKVLSDEEGAAFGIHHHQGVGYWQDCAEAVFMTTRGGSRYDRTFLEGFVRPGLDRRNWGSRCNYPALGVVQTGPEEMSLYVKRHNQQDDASIERLTLRLDGFAAVHAPYKGGRMTTKPLTFTGKGLWINYATGAGGHVRVEVQDEKGTPIPGYTFDEAHVTIGDEIERRVAWKQGPDVSTLQGRPVRLCFDMKDADLFALQFKEA